MSTRTRVSSLKKAAISHSDHPEPPKQKIVVIYHGRCPDGFGGAWAAWKKLGSRAAYFGARDRNAPPVPLKNKIVYLIDYTYDEPIVRDLIRDNIRVVAIDHHESQKEAIALTDNPLYDTAHSGAVLSWNYFHGKEKVPMMLRYIEDRDIWNWKISHSREMLACIDMTPRTFTAWSKLSAQIDDPRTRKVCLQKGKLLDAQYRNLFEKLLPNAEPVYFEGRKIYALNCPYYFVDDLGHILAERVGSMAILWSESGGRIRVGLRSNGTVDVSKIAKQYGGGGHPSSSGFSFSVDDPAPWKLLPEAYHKERIS